VLLAVSDSRKVMYHSSIIVPSTYPYCRSV
jgi:hypothetical protein